MKMRNNILILCSFRGGRIAAPEKYTEARGSGAAYSSQF